MLQITIQLEFSRVKFLVLVVTTYWSTLIRIMKVSNLNLSPKEGYPYISLIVIGSKQVRCAFCT